MDGVRQDGRLLVGVIVFSLLSELNLFRLHNNEGLCSHLGALDV